MIDVEKMAQMCEASVHLLRAGENIENVMYRLNGVFRDMMVSK